MYRGGLTRKKTIKRKEGKKKCRKIFILIKEKADE